MGERRSGRQGSLLELPQWNSRLKFSAQKPAAGETEGHAKDQARKAPILGQARRVPAGGIQGHVTGAQDHAAPSATGKPAGPDANKTPTLCLFEKFESLTISTPATTKNNQLQPHPTSPTTAGNSVKQAKGRHKRSVAFGTPAVLAYTPAAADAPAKGSTPLWSNAGHTPYSLTGGTAGHAVCIDADDEAGIIDVAGSRHGVCMELFSSIIAETEQQETPICTLPGLATPKGQSALYGQKAAASVDGAASSTILVTPAEQQQRILFNKSSSNNSNSAEDSGSTFSGFQVCPKTAAKCDISSSTPIASCHSNTAVGKVTTADSNASSHTATPDAGRMHSTGTATQQPAATPATAADIPAYFFGAKCDTAVGGPTPKPLATPGSKLRQPTRVPEANGAPMYHELKQLLDGARPPAADTNKSLDELLGSCDVLSPVRPKKQLQKAIGAGDQVLTPVRRSARKMKQMLQAESADVMPMLEATNFCYQPNEAVLHNAKTQH